MWGSFFGIENGRRGRSALERNFVSVGLEAGGWTQWPTIGPGAMGGQDTGKGGAEDGESGLV